MPRKPIRLGGFAVKWNVAAGVVALAVLASALPAIPGALADDPFVRTVLHSSQPNGAFTYHVTNPAGIAYDGWFNYTFNYDENLTFQVLAILPNGTVWRDARQDMGAPNAWEEGGLAYAGVLGYTVESPWIGGDEDNVQGYDLHDRYPTPELWYVVAWHRAESPISFEMNWAPGTTVAAPVGGTTGFLRAADLNEGVRAYAGGSMYASVADGYTHAPANSQTLAVFSWEKYNLPAVGRLSLDYGWGSKVIDYEPTLEPVTDCLGWYRWRAVVTTENPLRVDFDYAGATLGNHLFTLSLITFPAGTLPNQIYREALLFWPLCDIPDE